MKNDIPTDGGITSAAKDVKPAGTGSTSQIQPA